MNTFLHRYLTEHVKKNNKPRTLYETARLITAHVRPALGRLKVSEVTRPDVAKLHASLSETPYLANRVLALLSKAFSLAEVWGYRADHSNPCFRIQKFQEHRRERFLSTTEFEALGRVLLQAEEGPIQIIGKDRPVLINPRAILAIRLLLFTGARVSEILALRWEWINWNAGRAELPDSKTGAKHLVLPPPALDLLAGLDQPEDGCGYVVKGSSGLDPSVPLVNLKDPWRLLRSAAELDDVRLHDLRHTFASVAVADGLSLPLIGSLLGHASVATTARYAHLADDPRQSAARQIGQRIQAAIAGEPEAS